MKIILRQKNRGLRASGPLDLRPAELFLGRRLRPSCALMSCFLDGDLGERTLRSCFLDRDLGERTLRSCSGTKTEADLRLEELFLGWILKKICASRSCFWDGD